MGKNQFLNWEICQKYNFTKKKIWFIWFHEFFCLDFLAHCAMIKLNLIINSVTKNYWNFSFELMTSNSFVLTDFFRLPTAEILPVIASACDTAAVVQMHYCSTTIYQYPSNMIFFQKYGIWLAIAAKKCIYTSRLKMEKLYYNNKSWVRVALCVIFMILVSLFSP